MTTSYSLVWCFFLLWLTFSCWRTILAPCWWIWSCSLHCIIAYLSFTMSIKVRSHRFSLSVHLCWTFHPTHRCVIKLDYELCNYSFLSDLFNVGTPSGVHLFGHLLWSIFQSSTTHHIKQFLQVLSCFIFIFKFELISYLFSLKKFSPLPGFEPGTSPVPSRFATN